VNWRLAQFDKLHKAVLKIVRADAVCLNFMTAPSAGALVAITSKSTLGRLARLKEKQRDTLCRARTSPSRDRCPAFFASKIE
jgi:hypothetical protein